MGQQSTRIKHRGSLSSNVSAPLHNCQTEKGTPDPKRIEDKPSQNIDPNFGEITTPDRKRVDGPTHTRTHSTTVRIKLDFDDTQEPLQTTKIDHPTPKKRAPIILKRNPRGVERIKSIGQLQDLLKEVDFQKDGETTPSSKMKSKGIMKPVFGGLHQKCLVEEFIQNVEKKHSNDTLKAEFESPKVYLEKKKRDSMKFMENESV